MRRAETEEARGSGDGAKMWHRGHDAEASGSSRFQTAGRNPEFLFFGSTEQKCRPLRVC